MNEVPSGGRIITGVPTSITAFIGRALRGPVTTPVRVQSFAEFTQVFGGLWKGSTMSYAVKHFFEHGGADALIVRVHSGAASATGDDGGAITDADILGDEDARTGIHALEQADVFNLLCIPPPEVDRDLNPATWAHAAAYCKKRRAVLIIDLPSAWAASESAAIAAAESGVNALRTAIGSGDAPNAAVYFPRLRMPDPLSGNSLADFAPCGAVAGIVARTDAQRGVWKAPAGLEASFSGVEALTCPITDAQNRILNAAGLNCLRSFPAAGPVVWGARTLAGADVLAPEWKYLPVRRLALYLEESLYRGTQWAVFESNGELLWARIRLSAGAFMHDLFRRGAFQGAVPNEAYFVKCDSDITTPNDISQGIVNILVGFAPLKPAEFVLIRIRQMAGQAGSRADR